jgi:hypothetical protein
MELGGRRLMRGRYMRTQRGGRAAAVRAASLARRPAGERQIARCAARALFKRKLAA